MCGHVGIAGNLELRDEKTFKRLLLFDYLRGPDSTGLAVYKDNGDHRIVKMASHPLDLFDTKSYSSAVVGYGSSVFLGHNRLATKGKVNGVNAHPFECGHIIGAHNGTLLQSSWAELNKLLGEETEVDSKAIFMSIEKFGIEETVKNLCGAWALVWVDLERKTLNFLKNKERPLYMARSDDKRKLFWASEWPMLQAAIDLSDQKYDMHSDKEGYTYFSFSDNTHYEFKIEDIKSSVVEGKPVCKTLKGKEPPPVVSTVGYGNPTQGTSTTTSRLGSGSASGKQIQVVPLSGTNEDPFAGVIARDNFTQLAKHGCGFCKAPLAYEDTGLLVDLTREHILCSDCSGYWDETKIFLHPTDFDVIQKAL